jgi:two-component system, LytTR family, sensor kinase
MTQKQSAKIETYLPYVLAFLFSGLGNVLNLFFFKDIELENLPVQWLYYFAVLLSIWFINLKISERKLPFIVRTNLIYLALCILSARYLFPMNFTFVSFVRLIMPTVLFVVLQQSFRTQKEGEKLKLENVELTYKTELENLKKQMNPHFLFNSLATLQSIIRTDPEVAEKFVIKLSELYRNIIQNSTQNKVSLKEELEFTESYIFLQKTRFEEGLQTEITINPASLAHSLPSYALQLLVENCIKHNIVSDEMPLHIRIFQKDVVSVTVSNNFQPKNKKGTPSETGLANLQRRYELLGIEKGITIEQNEAIFSVTLSLF